MNSYKKYLYEIEFLYNKKYSIYLLTHFIDLIINYWINAYIIISNYVELYIEKWEKKYILYIVRPENRMWKYLFKNSVMNKNWYE